MSVLYHLFILPVRKILPGYTIVLGYSQDTGCIWYQIGRIALQLLEVEQNISSC